MNINKDLARKLKGLESFIRYTHDDYCNPELDYTIDDVAAALDEAREDITLIIKAIEEREGNHESE